ncbi:hypothetical protein [Variovorax sp. E3]|uniref:hypothetical protein n=1 Tax=Variovorax sp. E3 TaxID=1914993 RepID=UPI0018DB825C|nr:hypothetical protein [Variovorax sp. E3]
MFAFRSAAIPVLASFVFAGCTHLPATQPVKPEVLGALQPVEVKVGVTQTELYAAFVRSTAAASGAAACGAVPGLGILLAAPAAAQWARWMRASMPHAPRRRKKAFARSRTKSST